MKRVVILILTLTFLAVLYYAYTTTANSFSSVDVKKEGFTSAAPTRASECNCLPGYIPSKDAGGKYGGDILTLTAEYSGDKFYFYNPSGTNDAYEYRSNNTCGLPTSGDFTSVSHSDLFVNKKYNYRWDKSPCDIVNKNKNMQETFFCQRLGDPSSRRECY